jgi:hypothetical protein
MKHYLPSPSNPAFSKKQKESSSASSSADIPLPSLDVIHLILFYQFLRYQLSIQTNMFNAFKILNGCF